MIRVPTASVRGELVPSTRAAPLRSAVSKPHTKNDRRPGRASTLCPIERITSEVAVTSDRGSALRVSRSALVVGAVAHRAERPL